MRRHCSPWLRLLAAWVLFGLLAQLAPAHPVPREFHDRVVVVRLTPDAVVVDYHLEVDEWTVVFKDLPELFKREELARFQEKGPAAFYEAFTKSYAPILANLLVATLDGKELVFTCTKHSHVVKDSVQCDFVFRAPVQLTPGKAHVFKFEEVAFSVEPPRINLSLGTDKEVKVLDRTEPDEALKKKPLIDLRPGDEKKLRSLGATLEGSTPIETKPPPSSVAPSVAEAPTAETTGVPTTLLQLLLDSRLGFWFLMWLAAGFGAAHALTPGHGKTLVAAYLVGERGTVWHALLLGLIVTLTHTGAVLLVAALLPLFPDLYVILAYLGPVLVVALGFWLLLRRLANQPDHVHFGGGHHHHHHGHEHHHHHHHHGGSDHYHDEHGHAHPVPADQTAVGVWGLIVLGITGGIVPCTDAIIMLGLAAATHQLWLALPLLLAFSAGLAGVLVLIGVLVVKMKNFAGSHWSESRLFRALPILSALIVTALGLWLCYDSLRHGPH